MCVTGTISYLVKITEREMTLTPSGGGAINDGGVSISVGLSAGLSGGGDLLAQRQNVVAFKICTDGTSEVTENVGEYEMFNGFDSSGSIDSRMGIYSAAYNQFKGDLASFGAVNVYDYNHRITFDREK